MHGVSFQPLSLRWDVCQIEGLTLRITTSRPRSNTDGPRSASREVDSYMEVHRYWRSLKSPKKWTKEPGNDMFSKFRIFSYRVFFFQNPVCLQVSCQICIGYHDSANWIYISHFKGLSIAPFSTIMSCKWCISLYIIQFQLFCIFWIPLKHVWFFISQLDFMIGNQHFFQHCLKLRPWGSWIDIWWCFVLFSNPLVWIMVYPIRWVVVSNMFYCHPYLGKLI